MPDDPQNTDLTDKEPKQPTAVVESTGAEPVGKPPLPVWKILDRVFGFLVLAASLVLYYFTTCPVIYFGDAGELIVAASKWGVAHPPGYPAYIIPLALFMRLPLGWLAPDSMFLQPVAWQANFFSAVLGAITVWVVYLILLRLLRQPILAFAGALLVATCRTFWSQCGIAEVYTLNALLAALMVLMAIIQNESKPGSRGRLVFLRWGSIIWGLALANHHETAFFFPLWLTMLVLALQIDRESGRSYLPPLRVVVEGVFFLALGLLPYLYLPIAASRDPALNWGDPSNWQNFWKVLTRAEYRQAKAAISGNLVTSLDILLSFLYWTFIQYFPALILLAIAGFGIVFRKSDHHPALVATAVSLFLMGATFIIYFAGIDRPSMFFLEVYFIPWYIALGALVAIGVSEIVRRSVSAAPAVRHFVLGVGILIVLVGAWSGFARNYKACDMSDNIAGYVYSHDILVTLPDPPQKSLVITGGDEIFLFWYWIWIEGDQKEVAYVGLDALGVVQSWFWDDLKRYHPDIVLPDDPALRRQYSGDELRVRMLEALLRQNRTTHRFWMTVWTPALTSLLQEVPVHMVLDGPVLELEWDDDVHTGDYPRASVPDDNYLYRSLLNVCREGLTPFETEIYERYAAACYNLAVYFSHERRFSRAAEFASLCLQFSPDYSPGERALSPEELLAFNLFEAGDLELARQTLIELIEHNPAKSSYHSYLAEIYLEEGDIESAIRELESALRIDPGNELIRSRYSELIEFITGQNEQNQSSDP